VGQQFGIGHGEVIEEPRARLSHAFILKNNAMGALPIDDTLPRKQSVLGVGVSTTSYAGVSAICDRWVAERRAGIPSQRARFVTVTSVHGIVSAFFEKRFRDILNQADLTTPDGMPVVWAMRSFGVAGQTRVYGPDLMLTLCASAAEKKHRLFFYGARLETLQTTAAKLTQKFPGLEIAGMISPPFRALTEAESEAYARQIRESGADIVFVGLSTPKQENWMIANRDRLPGLVLFGVGAAFDFHAGRVEQAPKWMQRNGLEWFFRLTREPTRLWKRYLLITAVFPPLWALQKLRILRFQTGEN
jgi:N-acetylglucosaminyldiphosphoundecaprenol N-acetyl-beta-D-mannosaminyltransferase